MAKYIVRIPEHNIEIDARDEVDAFNEAVKEILFESADIVVLEDY